MSRKRQKTAEVLATMAADGEYEVTRKKEPQYRTVLTTNPTAAWFPSNSSIFAYEDFQYWNHVSLAGMNALNQIPIGTNEGERVGNRVSISKVDIKVHFRLGSFGNTTDSATTLTYLFPHNHIRLVLLLDTNSSQGDIGLGDGVNTSPHGHTNIAVRGRDSPLHTYLKPANTRYKVLYDETKDAVGEHTEATLVPAFTNVNGNGNMVSSIQTRHDFGAVDFHVRHQFQKPITFTYAPGEDNPRDHRFVLLWTINDYNSGYLSRTITTGLGARLYYTDP